MNNLFKTVVAFFVALMTVPAVQAQIAPLKPRDEVIDPYHLFITYYKTTNLVFPYAIKSVDRGSQDILAQAVKVRDRRAASERGFSTCSTPVFLSSHSTAEASCAYAPWAWHAL